ncbi:MAG TPA: cytochrome P450 [Herpetosiphonaceae bacterium]
MSTRQLPAGAPAGAPAEAAPAAGRCPIDHQALSHQKTARDADHSGRPVSRDEAGVWHVRGYAQARAVLRSTQTKQAGFKAELLEKMPDRGIQPILFQDGPGHHEQRRATARFFTPKAVSENYGELMENFADELLAKFQRERRVDLAALSMSLAVRVAGEVVGLTDSRLPGMDRRLDAFFSNDITGGGLSLRELLAIARGQWRMWSFFLLDVKPSIEARRSQPREDVISHLLGQGASDMAILTECVTFGAAGMATTREFISVAAWHMLEQPALRERYLAGDDKQREQILHELLRIEPVVSDLYRRATGDIQLEVEGVPVIIPRGSLIDVHIHATNEDESVVGEAPRMICPERQLQAERVGAAVMSFGDGAHRCPGAYIAIQETDIFLQKLLRLPGLTVAKKPAVAWNDLIKAYELRDFVLELR